MGEQRGTGRRVRRHRLVADHTAGVIADPMSGRDLRRLVASASVFPNAEQASLMVRLTAAAGALGVGRVLVSTDTFWVSAAVLRESRRRAEAGDPRSKLRTSRHARATSSAAAGSRAASAINADLVADDVKRAQAAGPAAQRRTYSKGQPAAYDPPVTGQPPDHLTQGHRTHHFDPARVDRLLSEDRRRMLPAEAILRAAGVATGQVVVDLGAGPGFFTLPAARLVGAGGRVYAVDVEPSMLDLCRRRAEEARLTGIETVHSAETQIPLPAATADRVLIAFVLHEADDVAALLREAARLLRPGGEIAVAEWRKAEGTPGPPLAHRIGEDDLAGFAAQVGLRPVPTDHRSDNYYLARLSR